MPFFITDSTTPIAAEALPALKLTEFCGQPARGCIYAYLKCYLYHGDFFYQFTVFDETPPPTQYAAVALSCDVSGSPWLSLRVGFHTPVCLEVHTAEETDGSVSSTALSCEDASRFSGGDEQGLYWGAQGIVPAAVFEKVFGSVPHAGSFLMANAFLYDTREKAFGAAFEVSESAGVPCAEGMQPLVVVPY